MFIRASHAGTVYVFLSCLSVCECDGWGTRVEFNGKYYRGDGRKFHPFNLHKLDEDD
jgi:hypothetical protein